MLGRIVAPSSRAGRLLAVLGIILCLGCNGIPVRAVNVTRGISSPEPGLVEARAELAGQLKGVQEQLEGVRETVQRIDQDQGEGTGLGALIAAILGTAGVGFYGIRRASGPSRPPGGPPA